MQVNFDRYDTSAARQKSDEKSPTSSELKLTFLLSSSVNVYEEKKLEHCDYFLPPTIR